MKIVDRYVPIMDTQAENYAHELEYYIGESRIFDIPQSIRDKFNNKEATILDLGTGRGRIVDAMRSKGYKFFGIDYSDIITAGKSPEGKARADARQLPFGDQTIDIIVSMGLVDEILYKQGGGGL